MSDVAVMRIVNDVHLLAVTRDETQLVIDTYGNCEQITQGRSIQGDATGHVVLNFDELHIAEEAEAALKEWTETDDAVSLMYDPDRQWASLTNQRTGDRVSTNE